MTNPYSETLSQRPDTEEQSQQPNLETLKALLMDQFNLSPEEIDDLNFYTEEADLVNGVIEDMGDTKFDVAKVTLGVVLTFKVPMGDAEDVQNAIEGAIETLTEDYDTVSVQTVKVDAYSIDG